MALRHVAIAGVYASRQARVLSCSTTDLVLEVVRGALDDAGLKPGDVDGVAVDWPGSVGLADERMGWARLLGGPISWSGDYEFLETAGVRSISRAAAAIATGLCSVAVIGGGLANGTRTVDAAGSRMNLEFTDCWGSYVAPQFALVAQRHMHEFGTRPEHLAEVAATIRNHGHVNPEAVMFGSGPYNIDDVLGSRMVTSPFHLLDLCLQAAGGAAVVLTSVDRARDLRHPVVVIGGAGMEHAGVPYRDPPDYRRVGRIGAAAARRAFCMAGVTPADADVFSLYDATSFEVIRQFEILGLCAEGEGGPFIEGGAIKLGGKYPTNPDGGLLSHSHNGYQQMTIRVIEATKQLRGEAYGRQVENAEVAVAGNAGAGAGHYEVAVLLRES